MKEEYSEDDPLLRKHSTNPTTHSAVEETVLKGVKTEVKVSRQEEKKILHQTIIRYPPVMLYNSGLGGQNCNENLPWCLRHKLYITIE